MLFFRHSFDQRTHSRVVHTNVRTLGLYTGLLDDSSRPEQLSALSTTSFAGRFYLISTRNSLHSLSPPSLSLFSSPFFFPHFRFFSHSLVSLRPSTLRLSRRNRRLDREEEGEGRRSRAVATQFNRETRFYGKKKKGKKTRNRWKPGSRGNL